MRLQIRIHPEGWKFLPIFVVGTVLLFLIGGWPGNLLGFTGIVLTAWCAYFFRDPNRVTPVGDDLVISPADGVVLPVVDAVPPAEFGMDGTPMRRVSIFMNVFDCHVNRSPVDGEILVTAYHPGKFVNASLDKASTDNERRAFRIVGASGAEIVVVQIAGLVARRIVAWAGEGQKVQAGERIGMIRFGSRVDVYLGEGATIMVAEGQRSVAGETVIAAYGSSGEDRTGAVR